MFCEFHNFVQWSSFNKCPPGVLLPLTQVWSSSSNEGDQELFLQIWSHWSGQTAPWPVPVSSSLLLCSEAMNESSEDASTLAGNSFILSHQQDEQKEFHKYHRSVRQLSNCIILSILTIIVILLLLLERGKKNLLSLAHSPNVQMPTEPRLGAGNSVWTM